MTLLLLLLACEPSRLAPLAEALARYEEGRAALERGDVEAGRAAMEAATAAHPRSAELQLWLGMARARAGDPAAAVAAADAALLLWPGWPLAHYNRACWALRAGTDEATMARAARDLQAALAGGAVDTLTAALDPDLQPLRGHAEHGRHVPPALLPLHVEASPEAAFLGSRWSVTLRVLHRAQDRPTLTLPPHPALPARPAQLVEDVELAEGLVRRGLSVDMEVLGPGEGSMGPWRVEAGPLAAEAAPLRWRFLAPEGTPLAQAPPLAARVDWPSARFDGLTPPAIHRDGDTVLVLTAPGDRVVWEAEEAVRWELREGGQPRWVGWTAPLAPGSPVAIERGGRTLLERSP